MFTQQQGCRHLTEQSSKKGRALTILLGVAATFISFGIFLHDQVLPPQPETEELLKATAAQSLLKQRDTHKPVHTEPSEVSRQLERAIEAANQNETATASRLEKRITASQTLIEEANQLLEEKGISSSDASKNEKLDRFNQQLNELQSRLKELKASY
jgi:flagellar biosynthesis/type III secretory pathway protein FliH